MLTDITPSGQSTFSSATVRDQLAALLPAHAHTTTTLLGAITWTWSDPATGVWTLTHGPAKGDYLLAPWVITLTGPPGTRTTITAASHPVGVAIITAALGHLLTPKEDTMTDTILPLDTSTTGIPANPDAAALTDLNDRITELLRQQYKAINYDGHDDAVAALSELLRLHDIYLRARAADMAIGMAGLKQVAASTNQVLHDARTIYTFLTGDHEQPTAPDTA